MSACIDVELRGPMDHLRVAWLTGETLLENLAFADDPEGTRYNVLVALQEVLTNVFRHAYDGDERRPVWLRYVADDELFEVTLQDDGPEFDPTKARVPPADTEVMPSATGGWGIRIAREVMDELNYRRAEGRNVLCMRKWVRGARRTGTSAGAMASVDR